ncbi:MAG: exo-alpha-sialidase, partial [Actinobacteria bacterium]|nr:exo-alpha-sialidase [Actinomycetota bacterium]
NYPVGAVNPSNPRQVAVTFGSYVNAHSKESNGCTPAGFSGSGNPLYQGVKTPGACNNDILVSVSNDGGATFTGTTTDPRALTSVNQAPGQATSDQFFQWADFTRSGTLAVSYYDRQYGADETTGYSDESISGSRGLVRFGTFRVTSSSMPPPTEFAGVFYGDYAGLSALDIAHPFWSDTRNPDLFLCPGTGTPTTPPAPCTGPARNAPTANDEDAFAAITGVPIG